MTQRVMVRLVPGEPSLVPAQQARKAIEVLRSKERRGK